MKKKIFLTLLALVCALCCAFGLTACGGGYTNKVKDETQWKQAIADARKSDNVYFNATIHNDDFTADILVKAAGNVQYLKTSMYTVETRKTETQEYYYDGEYVYLNVKEQDLGYDWQKIKADTVTEEFAEPLSYIDLVYSGELARKYGVEVTFDDLDKLSERYADAVYGVDGDFYTFTDGDMSYRLIFDLEDHELNVEIRSDNMYLSHIMGDEVTVTIPTTSVQEVGNTNDVSVVGKTFVFSKTECDVWDADRIASSDASNAGSVITFDTETTATAIAYNGLMVQKFTYTREDNEIKMTITEMTMNNEPMDISSIPETTFMLDGDNLVSIQRANEEGHYVYMTYVLQTAE